VAAAVEFLHAISSHECPLDLERVALVGHSAGGQLALATSSAVWRRRAGHLRIPCVAPSLVVGLGAITDLQDAYSRGLGDGALRALLGRLSAERAERHAAASPICLLPSGTKQVLLHGDADDIVPVAQAHAYAQAARDSGDPIECLTVEGAGHMDFLDPGSPAHAALCGVLAMLARPLRADAGQALAQ
jgi:acetyl esterase/lipase